MKVFLLKEEDFERLFLMIDRDPKHGTQGGSSQASVRDPAKAEAYDEAHRFYNYQVRTWVEQVKKA